MKSTQHKVIDKMPVKVLLKDIAFFCLAIVIYCGVFLYGNRTIVERLYYSNGSLKQEITYQKGQKNGIEKWYYEAEKNQSSQLEREIPYKDGQKNGTEIWYDKTGKIIQTTKYIAGKKDSISSQLSSETIKDIIRRGDADKLQQLSLNNPDFFINKYEIDGENAIFYLLKTTNLTSKDIIKYVDCSDLNNSRELVNKDGISLLSYVTIHKVHTFLDFLLDTCNISKRHIDYIDKKGRTAIMYAAIKNNVHAAEKLINKGADLHLSKDGNWTAYKYAKELNHTVMVDLLSGDYY